MQKEFVVQNFKRFRPYLVANAPLERLHTGVMWAEGPVYFPDLGVLLFSAAGAGFFSWRAIYPPDDASPRKPPRRRR